MIGDNIILFQEAEQQEITRKFILQQYKVSEHNFIKAIENSVSSYHWHSRDYFFPHEIASLAYNLNPLWFDFDIHAKYISLSQDSLIAQKFKELHKYKEHLNFLDEENIKNYYNAEYFYYSINPDINNMMRIICDAIRHDDLCYDFARYYEDVENNREYNIKLHRNEVKNFYVEKSFKSIFFGTTEIIQANSLASYQNPESPYYAPLLSCAIKLHEIFSSQPELCPPDNRINKMLGEYMRKWLEKPENSDLIGLDIKYRNDNARKLVITLAKWYQKEEDKPKKQKITPQ